MVGMSQSLNISCTCAMLIWHLKCQGILTPSLTDEEMSALYLKWLMTSSKNSAALLKKHGFANDVPDYL
jgi:hypothetical protein